MIIQACRAHYAASEATAVTRDHQSEPGEEEKTKKKEKEKNTNKKKEKIQGEKIKNL